MKKIVAVVVGLLVAGMAYGLPKYRTLAKVVTTAGTRVALSATEVQTPNVCIKANAANTGILYVGDVTVAAANGYPLAAGAVHCMGELAGSAYVSLSDIYLDAAVNGEGARVIYVTGR